MAYDDNYDDPGQKELATNAVGLIYNRLINNIPNTQELGSDVYPSRVEALSGIVDNLLVCHDIVHGINAYLIERARTKYNDEFVFRVVPDLVEGTINITHCGFTDDDRESGEYREINYGYKEPTSKVVAINKFDVHFDVRKNRYYLSDDIRIVLDNWLFHKIALPGNWSATTLMSREFKILIGGEEVECSSKG